MRKIVLAALLTVAAAFPGLAADVPGHSPQARWSTLDGTFVYLLRSTADFTTPAPYGFRACADPGQPVVRKIAFYVWTKSAGMSNPYPVEIDAGECIQIDQPTAVAVQGTQTLLYNGYYQLSEPGLFAKGPRTTP